MRIRRSECPACCRDIGLCHGRAFFLGKSGKPEICLIKCPYDMQKKAYHIREKTM